MYETGRLLTQMGCILAGDMTVECLFGKMSYLLGKGYTNNKVKKMMHKNLRGELTDTRRNKEKFSLSNNKMVMAIADVLQADTLEDVAEINDTITPVLVNSVVSTGNLQMLKKLHQTSGCDLNRIDYLGRAPIHVAAGTKGSLELTKFLCEQSINLDQLDFSGRSALFMAIVAK